MTKKPPRVPRSRSRSRSWLEEGQGLLDRVRPLPPPRPPFEVTQARVHEAIRWVLRMMGEVPDVPLLTTLAVQRHSGALFRGANDFCLRTADLLCANPARYPDLPDIGEKLNQQQRLADSFALLRTLLGHMTNRVHHAQITHQAEALKTSQGVIATVMAGLQHPNLNPALDHDAREEDIRCPLLVLDEEQARQTARQRARRAQRATPPAAPSPAKARAQAQRREDDQQQVIELIQKMAAKGAR